MARDILYTEEIVNLKFVLSEVERENMELEYECFSVPEGENTPHIKNIIEEFKEKFNNESEKHK